jgi:glutamine cyclotransferase
VAFEYDLETFRQIRSIPYAGEGWGLCRNDTSLVMSDGSDQLQFRDPISFDEVAPRVSVTLDGGPVGQLNELECVDGFVWANIWLTDSIVQIDPADGAVTAVVDASGLERPDEADVLNGIAYDPAAESYLLTGKLWPAMYEVRFVPA